MIRNYLELEKRSHEGQSVSKDVWDLEYVVMTTMDIVQKYELSWEKDTIIPNDPELLDRIFAAGKELLETIGVYNMSTGKVIKLSREEIEEGLRHMKTELVMGEGKDARTLYARKPEDTRRPLVWAGNPGCPTPEYMYQATIKSWLQEPVVDMITCGSLIDVDGYPVRTHSPSEVMAVKRELQYLRGALKQTGRSGMGMLAAESSTSEIGDLSAVHPEYLRPCDSHLVAMFNELIIDTGNMIRAASSIEYGMRNASLATAMVGGHGGDTPGATVIQIASFMAANIVCRADYHLCHPIHINHVATSTRGCMWLQSITCQAFAKHAPAIIVCDIYPKSGAMTKELLYEVAANAIAITVSGGHLEGVGAADGRVPHGTGVEVRLMGKVGRAVAASGITREQANEIINQLLAKYEHVFTMPGGNDGVAFDVAYDLATVTPKPEWEAMYQEVVEELGELGLVL